MNALYTIVAALVLSGTCLAQTITDRIVDVPFSVVIQGTCEDEPVALVGLIRSSSRRSETTDGIIRIDSRDMLKGEGTGLITGTKYQLSNKTTSRTFFSSEGIISVAWRNQLTLIGPGPDNDMFITYVVKQLGDVIVVDDFKGVCK